MNSIRASFTVAEEPRLAHAARCPMALAIMSAVIKLLFVDGWHGPDPGDWQELWASRTPGAARVTQDNWDVAEAGAWMAVKGH